MTIFKTVDNKVKLKSLPYAYSLITILILLAGFICQGCSIKFGPSLDSFDETVISGDGDDKVLLLDVQGFISNASKKSVLGQKMEVGMVEKIREILAIAEKDSDIKALWLKINSPGGTVTSSDIIYHEIKMFKKRKKVKVYASVLDMAASGGYYIAVAADKIIVHPTSLVGSIGVIAVKLNAQNLMGKVGLEWEVVKSGDKKDFLSPFRPFTPEERKLFQETIDGFHNRFVHVIAENRPQLDLNTVGELADGRIYSSKQAQESGLIDNIAYMDETESVIKADLGSSAIKVVTYHRPGQFKNNVYSSLPVNPSLKLIDLKLDILPKTNGPAFLYYWMP
jgi:protease-4